MSYEKIYHLSHSSNKITDIENCEWQTYLNYITVFYVSYWIHGLVSNKELSDNEILNQLFPEDVDMEEMGHKSGVKDSDTEVESCSEAKDELEGWGHSLHYRAGSARQQPSSCHPAAHLGMLPDHQVTEPSSHVDSQPDPSQVAQVAVNIQQPGPSSRPDPQQGPSQVVAVDFHQHLQDLNLLLQMNPSGQVGSGKPSLE